MKPSEYTQRLRVNEAREEVELTRASIEEIAWKVGYRDDNAFRRVFHRVIGLSHQGNLAAASKPTAATYRPTGKFYRMKSDMKCRNGHAS